MSTFFLSFAFPIFGYILSSLQFIFYKAEEDINGEWIAEKNEVLIQFGFAVLGMLLSYAGQKCSFGYMGEKLTFTLRV